MSDFDATTASLKWKAPANDGGAPIKEYQVEFRVAKTQEWLEGPQVKPKKFLTCVVEELTTNTKYEFRVSFLLLRNIVLHSTGRSMLETSQDTVVSYQNESFSSK